MVRFGRTDANQSDVVGLLRQIPGVSVKVISDVGDGFTDLVIGYKDVNYLVELKDGDKPPSKQALTPDQKDFHGKGGKHPEREWKGQKAVCNSLEQVLEVIGITRGV